MSSFNLKQTNRRKANVVNPSEKAGSMKQMNRPMRKFVDPFDISKEAASNKIVGRRFKANHAAPSKNLRKI